MTNLLPDARIRERLSRRFRTKNAEAFTLLEAIGRDCAGLGRIVFARYVVFYALMDEGSRRHPGAEGTRDVDIAFGEDG